MLNEIKILFNNIKQFRNLLTESVSDTTISDSINNHEYIYIYYEGDPETGGIARGARTVRPYVLGVSTAGNKVVRCWQDKGKSFSLSPQSPRRRKDHEYHIDLDGKEKAGWRLFRLDRISSLYPTGKRFVDENGKVIIPPLYNENDKQMVSIITSIKVIPDDQLQTKDLGSIEKPDVTKQKVDKSVFDKQTGRFKQFYNIGAKKREATSKDIENLYRIATKVMKKSVDKYLIATDNKGNFHLVDKINKDKISPEAVVGELRDLYNKFVLPNKPISSKENDFFDKIKNDLEQNIKNKNK